jgi:hypothetical protein
MRGQTDEKKKENAKEDHVLPVKSASENQSSGKGLEFVEGTIPTPEDQGFTKKTVEGKEIYYKEAKGIMIEYQPKNN